MTSYIAVRDTKNRAAGALAVSPAAFTATIQAGNLR
jgi:uncharacterized protein DUF397